MAEKVRFSQKQRKAIKAMMTASTIAEAAKAAGCSERQLYRWLDAPAFVAEVRKAEAEALDAAVRRLASLANDAITALEGALAAKTETKAVTIRAADIILGRAVTLREFTELEQRLAAIEQSLKGSRNEK